MKLLEINLLPKQKSKVADKLIHFVLYYFRYIIVITQIVVIGVFFFRFRVDQNVIDLKESFKQKQQILAVTIPIVEEAKAIQVKTEKVSSVLDSQDLFLARLNFLLQSIPQDATLRNLALLENSVTIDGTAANVFSVRALHRKIAQTEGFEGAEIHSLDRSPDNTFDFSIKIPLDVPDETP